MAINVAIWEKPMANWIKCSTAEGEAIRLNLDQVAIIRPHHSDRGFKGNEIIFASGNLSSILVNEDQEYLAGPQRVERGRDEV
jgi:hypothetical protein